MRRTAFLFALSCFSLFAQAPAAPADPTALVPTEDPGVARAVLIRRPEFRVLRVELQPGAVRRVHQHDDVRYHLFLPITPGIEVTIGSDKPVQTKAGQAYYMRKSTPHGFRNTGTSVAMVFEIFVNEDAPVAATQELNALLLALATPPENKK